MSVVAWSNDSFQHTGGLPCHSQAQGERYHRRHWMRRNPVQAL